MNLHIAGDTPRARDVLGARAWTKIFFFCLLRYYGLHDIVIIVIILSMYNQIWV